MDMSSWVQSYHRASRRDQISLMEIVIAQEGVEHNFMGRRIGNLLCTKGRWKKLLVNVGYQVVKT
jgi:hypothetical protein